MILVILCDSKIIDRRDLKFSANAFSSSKNNDNFKVF